MTTAQAETDVLITIRARFKTDAYAIEYGIPTRCDSERARTIWNRDERRIHCDFFASLQNKVHRLFFLRAYNRRYAGPNDGCLLCNDLSERVTKIFFMIHSDWRDRDNLGAGSRCRIEPPAQSGFENCQLDLRFAKSEQSDRRHVLEKRWQRFKFAAPHKFVRRLFHFVGQPREFQLGNLFVIYADSFSD